MIDPKRGDKNVVVFFNSGNVEMYEGVNTTHTYADRDGVSWLGINIHDTRTAQKIPYKKGDLREQRKVNIPLDRVERYEVVSAVGEYTKDSVDLKKAKSQDQLEFLKNLNNAKVGK